MSWSSAFRQALAEGRPLRHRLRTVTPPDNVTRELQWTIGATVGDTGLVLTGRGSSGGQSVSVGSWDSSIGGWMAEVAGDPRRFRDVSWRGQIVVHECASSTGDWEPVEAGVYDDIEGSDSNVYRLRFRDLTAALQTRYTTTAARWSLFDGWAVDPDDPDASSVIVNHTHTSASWNVGGTTMQLDDLSQIGTPTEGGLVCVHPERPDTRPSATDRGRFYLRFTGASADTGVGNLTGLSTFDVALAGRRYNIGTWVTVQRAAGMVGHPMDIVSGMLTDTPPASTPTNFSFGLPASLTDAEDIARWRALCSPSSGSDEWVLLTDYAWPNALGSLRDWLSVAGLWLSMRQGRLTVRCCVDPAGMSEASVTARQVFGAITGDWCVPGSVHHTDWGGGLGSEYYRVTVVSPADSADYTNTVHSHPAEDQHVVDLSDRLAYNEPAQRDLTAARIQPWVLTLPESIELAYLNPLARGLCPGDLLAMHLPHVGGRADQTGSYDGRIGMVISADPDWWGNGPTKIRLSVPPPLWWQS